MNCKYCNAELPEDVTLCPVCGKEQQEAEETAVEAVEETTAEETVAAPEMTETEEPTEPAAENVPFETDYEAPAQDETKTAPKASPRKIAAAVVAGILVLAILIGVVVGSLSGAQNTDPTIAPTSGVAETVVIPSSGDPASALCKASYTVSDEAAAAAADVVVATMGDKTLTNGELQAYYWQEIYMFLEQNYSYAMYMGLDPYKPLDQQLMDMGEVSLSWQQFFLDSAIATWKNYQALALEAEAENYQMPADRQEELNAMPADLEAGAVSSGFANGDEMVKANVGPNCTLESYMGYVKTYYQGMSYYEDYCNALNPSDAEIEAYYEENKDAFEGSGITKDAKFVDVRHVLLQPEGNETGEDGYPVFTDEAWEACRIQAEELYNKWQEGDKSEDSFAQLAMEYSVDGSASRGGLYEGVAVGQMVEEFNDWCFDEARQAGDHGLVKTVYGYHIMFFSAHRGWRDFAKNDLINKYAYEVIPATVEKYPATVDFSLVELANISFE